MTTAAPSLGAALGEFRQANGLRPDEAARAFWQVRFGPVTLTLPNFAWRRRAIEAHDLHHVLTGYACSLTGEFQVASWEFGAGAMPHWGAALFCLPLVGAGLFWSPAKIFAAFSAGRRSQSLHGREISADLLATPLPIIQAQRRVAASGAGFGSDLLRFGLLVLASALLLLAPALLVFALLRS